MGQVVIENPILNSPFSEPARHFRFSDEGIKGALDAEVDESAWSALYSTESRPFGAPKTGDIAVKVINHYGDEVLKVVKLAAPAKSRRS